MQVLVFELPHVFSADSNPTENAKVLRASLDYLIKVDEIYLSTRTIPALYQSGVRYGRTSEWDPIPAVTMRKYGDCKSLTAWRIAELRKQGVQCIPCFRWIARPSQDGNLYHILVQRHPCPQAPNGYEDPSEVLGMPKHNDGWGRTASLPGQKSFFGRMFGR